MVRSFFQEYVERVVTYRDTVPYQKAMRKRKLWPEPLFGEAKQWHGLQRFRLRRLWRVNVEAVMVAAGQNLKRLLRYQGKQTPFQPVGAGALPQPAPCMSVLLIFDRNSRLKELRFEPFFAAVRRSGPGGLRLFQHANLFCL